MVRACTRARERLSGYDCVGGVATHKGLHVHAGWVRLSWVCVSWGGGGGGGLTGFLAQFAARRALYPKVLSLNPTFSAKHIT